MSHTANLCPDSSSGGVHLQQAQNCPGMFKLGDGQNDSECNLVDGFLRLPPVADCIHTRFYCEENVWKLCDYVRNNQPELLDNCFAVFISNENGTIPLWQQIDGKGQEFYICWDYHAIFMYYRKDKCAIYDMDSLLPFPSDFRFYRKRVIKSDDDVVHACHRKFRVVPAEMYLETFASDRSHMKRSNGNYREPPPRYNPISTKEYENNIKDFISMDPSVGFGTVMDIEEFYETFNPPSSEENQKGNKSQQNPFVPGRGDLSNDN